MPTYEYVCNACGHAFEKFQSMSAAPIKACPSCGKNEAQRQISGGAGFIFKGGGFYETDYRSEAYKKSAEADKAASSGGEPKSDAKSGGDAKPDAKPAETKATDAKAGEAKPAAAKEPAAAPPVSKPELSKSAAPTPPPVGG